MGNFFKLVGAVVVGLFVLGFLSEASKPANPVVVSYRSSLVGEGYVASFSNTSNGSVTVSVELKNAQLNQQVTTTMTLGAGESREIGWMEGWKFLSGETITISSEAYQTRKWRVP